MGTIKFERTAKACDIVVDQFKLGSFGGIMFKALAIGAPVCTFLDEGKMSERYSESPPVINCQTEDEIFQILRQIIENPAELSRLSKASRMWMEKYHSSNGTTGKQLQQYQRFIGNILL